MPPLVEAALVGGLDMTGSSLAFVYSSRHIERDVMVEIDTHDHSVHSPLNKHFPGSMCDLKYRYEHRY